MGRRRSLLFLLTCCIVLWSRESAGETGGDDHRLGLEVGLIGTMLHDGHHAAGGVGGFVEIHVIPHWLHLELAGLVGRAGDASFSLLDIVFKYPHHLTDRIELFGGAGLTIPFVAEAGGTESRPGLTLTAGAFLWFRPPFGAVLAGVFNVLSSPDGALLEGGLNGGLALQL
jgi:hypothetical protein